MTDQLLQPSQQKAGKSASKPRYVLLWERIQVLEGKLKSQEAMQNAILRQFTKLIRPREESVADAILRLTQELMRCFHNAENDAHRSLLGFWIIDNFKTLNTHPFANEFQVQELYDAWRLPLQGTDDMVEAQLSLLMAGETELPGQSRQRSHYPDADMFAKPAKPECSEVREDFDTGDRDTGERDSHTASDEPGQAGSDTSCARTCSCPG